MKNILIVEDDPSIREMVRFTLEKAEFQLSQAETAEQAIDMMASEIPDLAILDWMLPGMSGVELAKRMRKDEVMSGIPIILLTARAEEQDRVHGLNVGADDYLTKPFSPRELVARINAVLRRTRVGGLDSIVEIAGLRLDSVGHRIEIDSQPMDLAPTEYRLLEFFMTHPDRVYSREQLLDHVWGRDVYIEVRTVDVHIRRLRKLLAKTGHDKYIQTVRGAGYRFSVRV